MSPTVASPVSERELSIANLNPTAYSKIFARTSSNSPSTREVLAAESDKDDDSSSAASPEAVQPSASPVGRRNFRPGHDRPFVIESINQSTSSRAISNSVAPADSDTSDSDLADCEGDSSPPARSVVFKPGQSVGLPRPTPSKPTAANDRYSVFFPADADTSDQYSANLFHRAIRSATATASPYASVDTIPDSSEEKKRDHMDVIEYVTTGLLDSVSLLKFDSKNFLLLKFTDVPHDNGGVPSALNTIGIFRNHPSKLLPHLSSFNAAFITRILKHVLDTKPPSWLAKLKYELENTTDDQNYSSSLLNRPPSAIIYLLAEPITPATANTLAPLVTPDSPFYIPRLVSPPGMTDADIKSLNLPHHSSDNNNKNNNH